LTPLRLLADENLPRILVDALRQAGHDVVWVATQLTAARDSEVLAFAQAEARIVLTFDRGFGELAFRRRLPASSGVILLRLSTSDPENLTLNVVRALDAREDWRGHFSVIEEHRIRLTPLP
jgi:predicted nuclease of predicted toxin-antitoxin system